MKPYTPSEPSGSYGTLPPDGPRDLAATLDDLSRAALLGLPLIDTSSMAVDPSRPSSVRVFGKSLHMLTGGWTATILWLWSAGVRQSLRREGMMPPDFGLSLLLFGLAAGVALAACAFYVTRKTGAAPYRAIERLEWRHAFWWSFVPNAMLLLTAYLIIAAAY